MQRRKCVLYEERDDCIECGDCSICDLDPSKVCDNCGKCIGLNSEQDYRAIVVDGIITADMDPSDYLYDTEETDPPDEELVWP